MLTEKDYCDRDTAIALQKLGYNNKYCRDDGTPIISLYEAQKWLREKHNLHIEITYSPLCWTSKIYNLKKWYFIKGFTFIESYEEALSEGVKCTVKILKEEQYENIQ